MGDMNSSVGSCDSSNSRDDIVYGPPCDDNGWRIGKCDAISIESSLHTPDSIKNHLDNNIEEQENIASNSKATWKDQKIWITEECAPVSSDWPAHVDGMNDPASSSASCTSLASVVDLAEMPYAPQ